ncbi:OadG family protein [Tissierella pigra]|uniref:OadG family protein n=1 Tax=Tissierella pigra TaxID=2607614 RepID=UPI001C10965C|nr:OadG family protein [Tissierella pigra]MBU5425516.1 OadG family protein [Tissierella pigra]
MGEYVSFGESIVITIFSMVVVFVGLIVLAMLISVLKAVGNKADKGEVAKEAVTADRVEKTVVKENINKAEKDIVNNEEIVAVIAAAIAASLGISVPEVNIKSIKRVPQKNLAWSTASRQEQINGKL